MRRLHQPPVERGKDGHGLASMRCQICHKDPNFDRGGVPGDPAWHLAPIEMGWEGKTAGEICAQIKDPARNGGRSLDDIVTHIGTDDLVGWAWAPGAGRQPAPGTQQNAGSTGCSVGQNRSGVSEEIETFTRGCGEKIATPKTGCEGA